MIFSIKDKFTTTPGLRYRDQTPFSGQEFREDYLEGLFIKAREEQNRILIDFDGVLGYPRSFLEEAFGGLARNHSPNEVEEAFEFKCEEWPHIVEKVKEFIHNANKK